jgi:hypothetical protein
MQKSMRPDFNQMIAITVKIFDQYDIRFDNRCRIFVDGANPSFIRTLKDRADEDTNYEQQISYYKKSYPSVYDLQFLQQIMFVIPVQFAKYYKQMLSHCKEMLEYKNAQVAINPMFTKLIAPLRTPVENWAGALEKEATSHDDCFVASMLCVKSWR